MSDNSQMCYVAIRRACGCCDAAVGIMEGTKAAATTAKAILGWIGQGYDVRLEPASWAREHVLECQHRKTS